jgi:hypothetical protein
MAAGVIVGVVVFVGRTLAVYVMLGVSVRRLCIADGVGRSPVADSEPQETMKK